MSGAGYQPSAEDLAAMEYLTTLMADQDGGKRFTLEVGPAYAFTLVGFLQLSLRQEQVANNPYLKAAANQLCHQLSEPFRGTPVWGAIQHGYNPCHDVTQRIEGE